MDRYLLITLLAFTLSANAREKWHITIKEKAVKYEVPDIAPDPEKRGCWFGDTTSASQLEKIHYDLITQQRDFKSDPNLMP